MIFILTPVFLFQVDAMQMQLTRLIDRKLKGALTRMAAQDARTPALQLLWLAQNEAHRRGLLEEEITIGESPTDSTSNSTSRQLYAITN
jgi:hypothetical protein